MAEKLYTTLSGSGEGMYSEKKSDFLGFAKHVTNEAEAIAFIASLRKQYSDARHHVYAYLLTEGNATRYSDDGEPQGTAGPPVLDVLAKRGIVDAVVVVIRYFGGTLLGTGGLVRAYTEAAKSAVEDAGVVTLVPYAVYSVKTDYADYQKLASECRKNGITVEDAVFTDRVVTVCSMPQSKQQEFLLRMQDLFNGRVNPEYIQEKMGENK
ncbi:MAG: YigZ family protein [Ruminococcaceae bacterium]|nr:YigZ family protein [Oscillospiraceae bacterium]